MNRLIHTSEGELVEEDPFSAEGTKVYNRGHGYGVISKVALQRQERLTREHDASFFNPERSINVEWNKNGRVSYVNRRELKIVDG